MNGVPLHPALVHIPLGLAVAAPILAIVVVVAIWRGWLPPRAWLIVALVQVLIAGGTLMATSTGEDDEEKVEKIAPRNAVHEHEQSGRFFQWGALIAAVISLMVLAAEKHPIGRPTMIFATILTLVVAAIAVRTGFLGGKLVYEHGAARAHEPGGAPAADDHDDHDDH